jgi:hypothetical protein
VTPSKQTILKQVFENEMSWAFIYFKDSLKYILGQVAYLTGEALA